MIFQVENMDSFIRYAEELKATNAVGLVLKEVFYGADHLPQNLKLCLQTNIVNVYFESPERDFEHQETKQRSVRMVKELEKLYRIVEVQTLTVNTKESTSNVLF